MDTFYNLEVEKQEQIINGAMNIFASHSYKKASMSDIAKRTSVSKPTLFYHFGTKLELYFFLLDIAFEEISKQIDIDEVNEEDDFFECLRISSQHKMRALRKRPSLIKFLTNFYFETAPEIERRKVDYLKKSDQMRNKLVFEDLDISKFKNTVDPKLVMDMLLKWTEGYIATLEKSAATTSDEQISQFYDKMIADFLELIDMLRTNFYKPEYV